MNNYTQAYRETARDETRLHELSEDRKTLDTLIEFNSSDVEAKKKFSKTLDRLDYKTKRIEVTLFDGRKPKPQIIHQLYERVGDDLVDIVSPIDLETGRHIMTLYQVPTNEIQDWHKQLAGECGSYAASCFDLQAANSILFGATGGLFGVYIEPFVNYASHMIDLPPMGAAVICTLALSSVILGSFTFRQKMGYLAKTKAAQGHEAAKMITRLYDKEPEPLAASQIPIAPVKIRIDTSDSDDAANNEFGTVSVELETKTS